MVEQYLAPRCWPVEWVEALKGCHPDARHYDRVISRENVDVLKADGTLLLAYRVGKVPPRYLRWAQRPLLNAATPTDRRTDAAGGRRVILNGTVGYFQRRPATFNEKRPGDWRALQPLLRAMDAAFREERPDEYAVNLDAARRAPPHLVIPGTAFTTLTANRDDTRVHQDDGNLPGGYGVLAADRSADFAGGLLVFPRYGVAVDLWPGDVLIADNREHHGNTPFLAGWRVSAIAYFHASNLPS